MGYAEEAKIGLGKLKGGETDPSAIAAAQLQATLAVVVAVEELSSQVAYLSDLLEGDKKPG